MTNPLVLKVIIGLVLTSLSILVTMTVFGRRAAKSAAMEQLPRTVFKRDQVLYWLAGMDFSLIKTIVETSKGGPLIDILYPRWSCLGIYDYPNLLYSLQYLFLEKFGNEVNGKRIFAATTAAYDFFKGLLPALERKGLVELIRSPFEVENLDTNIPTILFDIELSTGKMVIDNYRYLNRRRLTPQNVWVVLCNDLIPVDAMIPSPLRGSNDPFDLLDLRKELKYLFKGTELAAVWEKMEGLDELTRLARQLLKPKNLDGLETHEQLLKFQEKIAYELSEVRQYAKEHVPITARP